ncbi:hypothetical protein Cpir12675_002843 [Ceratocystis pirilliformis]|uniref:Uncharacterized protein n=1 Tax=Ceratocystis pirilliformis TaxID=259994 RepID=A0ABR3Z846_9PEZI
MSRIGGHMLSNRLQPSASQLPLHSAPAGWIEVSSQVDLPDLRPTVRRNASSRTRRTREDEGNDTELDGDDEIHFSSVSPPASRRRAESLSLTQSPCLPPSSTSPVLLPQESPVLGAQSAASLLRISRTQSLNTTHSHRSGARPHHTRSQLHDTEVGRQPSLNADQQSGLSPLQKKMQRIRIFDGDTITDNDDDRYENSSEQKTSSKEKKSPKSEGYSTVNATLEKKIQRIRIFDGDTITDGEDKDESHDVNQNSDMLTKQPPERRNAIHTEVSLKVSHSLQGEVQHIRIFDGDNISNDDSDPNRDSAQTSQLAEDNSTLASISPVLDGSRGRKLNTRIAVRTDFDSPIANRGSGPFDSQQPPPVIPSPLVPSPLDNSAIPLAKSSAIQNPYYGQWNLQESHLAEPLIAPGRNRSVSPDSRKDTLVLVSLERKATQTSIAQTVRSDLSSTDTDEYHEYDKELEVDLSAKKCQVSGNSQTPAVFPPPKANTENPKTKPPMLECPSRPCAPPPLNTVINDWDKNEASPAGPGRPSPADSKVRRTSLFRGLGLKLPSKDKDRDNGLNILHKSSFEELGQARRKSSSFFKMRNSSPGGLTPSPSTHSFSRSALSATSSTGHPPWAYTKASSDRPMSAHSPLSTSLSGPRSANSPLGNDLMSSGSIPSSATRSRFSGITGIFRQSLSGPSTGPKMAASHGNLRDVAQSPTHATTIIRSANNAALAFTPSHIHHRSNTRPLARPASQVLSPTGWEAEEWNGPKSAGLVSQFNHSKPNLQPESLPSSRLGDSELLLSASVPQRRRQNSPYRKAHGNWSEFMPHSSNASVCNQMSSSPTPSGTACNQTTLPGSPGLSVFPTRRGGIERDDFFLRAHKSTNSLISASSAEYRSAKMAMRDLASQHDRAISSGSSRLGEIHQFPDSSSLRSIPSYAVPAPCSPLAEPSTVPALSASRDIETPSSATLPHSSAWSGHSIPRSHPYPHPASDFASTLTSGNQATDIPSLGAVSNQSNLHFSQTTQQDQHQQGTLSKWLGSTKPTQTQFSKGQLPQQTRPPQQSKGLAKSFLGVFKKITSKASDPTLGQDSSTPQIQPDQSAYNKVFQPPILPTNQYPSSPTHSEPRSLLGHVNSMQAATPFHHGKYQGTYSKQHIHTLPYNHLAHEETDHQSIHNQVSGWPTYSSTHTSETPYDPQSAVPYQTSMEPGPYLQSVDLYASPPLLSGSEGHVVDLSRDNGTVDNNGRTIGTPTSITPMTGFQSTMTQNGSPQSSTKVSPHHHMKTSNVMLEDKQTHYQKRSINNRYTGGSKTGQSGETMDKKTEDTPMMSATAYPGQEWNPYRMTAFDDSD